MTELIAALMVAGIFAVAWIGIEVYLRCHRWYRRWQVARQTRSWRKYAERGGW
jgi:hypothetical protein